MSRLPRDYEERASLSYDPTLHIVDKPYLILVTLLLHHCPKPTCVGNSLQTSPQTVQPSHEALEAS